MSEFQKNMPDPEVLLILEPEELAAYLLEFFHSIPEKGRQHAVMRPAWFVTDEAIGGYDPKYREPIAQALLEAWS